MEKVYILELVGIDFSHSFKAFRDKNQALKLKNKIEKWLKKNDIQNDVKTYMEVEKDIILVFNSKIDLCDPYLVIDIPEDLQGYILWESFGPMAVNYKIREMELI